MSNEVDQESVNNLDSENEETITAMELLGAQISAALLDLADQQSEITAFFNRLLHEIEGLATWIDDAEETSLEMMAARASLTNIKKGATQSALQFQAFDRVEQLLRHVMKNLQQMSDLADTAPCGLLDLIESTYSLEHEHTLLNLARHGATRKELLTRSPPPAPQQDDNELF